MLYDKVKYKLLYRDETTIVREPIEWNDISKDFIRNKNYHGIIVSLTESLTFTGESRDIIVDIFNEDGVNADVIFIREIKDDETDLWENDFTGTLDFMTISMESKEVNIKVSNSDKISRLESKKSAEIEIERLTSLTEETIDPVPINKVYIEGRKLLLTGMLELDTDNFIWISGNCNNGRVYAPPFLETEQSEVEDLVPVMSTVSRTDVLLGLQEEMFMGYNDTGADLHLRINVKMSFPIKVFYGSEVQADNSIVTVKLRIARFNGLLNNYVDSDIIWEWNGTDDYVDIESDEITKILGIEESASLQFYVEATGSSDVTVQTTDFCIDYGFGCGPMIPHNGSITVQNDNLAEPSNSNFILVHDFAAKFINIITESSFRSNLLGRESMGYAENGKFSAIGILHGLWLRGISAGFDNYKPLSITWTKFYESLDTVYPIGLTLDGDTFVLEDRIEFYRPEVTIDLGEVSDLKVAVQEKNYYSLIDIGYEKTGGYDEKQGLDDPNRKTQYSTILYKTDNILKLISSIRSDSYGLETVRRDVGDLTSDTSFDDDKWWLELVEVVGQNWEMAGWEDKFAKAPGNVYSVETLINTWFTPINIILRQGKWLKPPLKKYLDSKILYTFSEGNSSITTQLIDGIEYKQNDGVPVGDLDYAIHTEMEATFKSKITSKVLNGRTNGKKDIHGLVAFTFESKRYEVFVDAVKLKNGIGEFTTKLHNSYVI